MGKREGWGPEGLPSCPGTSIPGQPPRWVCVARYVWRSWGSKDGPRCSLGMVPGRTPRDGAWVWGARSLALCHVWEVLGASTTWRATPRQNSGLEQVSREAEGWRPRLPSPRGLHASERAHNDGEKPNLLWPRVNQCISIGSSDRAKTTHGKTLLMRGTGGGVPGGKWKFSVRL